jgi:murein DD-endopeptidase MepM/ murein hydrolase activator NlpD
VKKNRFTEFFKGKGYYVLLFVGVIAIAAVAVVGSQISTNQQQEDNNFVDLNDVSDNIAAEDINNQLAEYNPISEGIVNQAGISSENTVVAEDNSADTNEVASNDLVDDQDMIEYEGYAEDNVTTEVAEADEISETAQDIAEVSTNTAVNETTETKANLSFNEEEGLMWPVMGNVIMNYSMDHTIYFATLMQYKCNPAIIIDAEVGTEVKAAATGVVIDVDRDNEETGLTVTMDIGDGYNVVYGQLANVDLEVGDLVDEGAVIGTIAEPTKYYTVEGSNLYFQVLNKGETVNPMLLLR